MCCSSELIEFVSDTRIHARLQGDRQYLAYEMKLSTATETAMVLPIPVSPGCADDAVEFLDFEAYANLFDDLDGLFPAELSIQLFRR